MSKSMLNVAALALLVSSTALAQTVDKDLGGNGDWKAAQVSAHTLWKNSACIAYTKAGDGVTTLELFAPQEGQNKGSFTEPTIQVVTKEVGFVRGILTDGDGASPFQLTLASTREDKPALGLLARFDNRTKIVDLLKKASSAKVQLINAKGKVLKTLVFSLKGSTKTIESTVSACQLML